MTSVGEIRTVVPALPDRPRRLHRPLLAVTLGLTVMIGVGVAGALLDDRQLLGHPIWMKPLKFAMSFAAYSLTLAWLLSLQTRARRLGWWMGTVLAAGVAAEMVIITGQVVVRGRQLHFNQSTPTDTLMHNLMALAVYVIWIAAFVIAVQLLFDKPGDRALRWSIRLALGTSLVGMLAGSLMFRSTPAQEQALAETGREDFFGAHSVGAEDDGAGMPITGWSTEGGDLRVGHFLGIHALQLLPLVALGLVLLSRRFPVLRPEGPRTALVWIAAAAYGGLIWLTLWQAQRGESLVQPGQSTLFAAVSLLTATVVAALAVLLRARRTTPASV
ncbi:hypothetical protein [Kribbella sp. CA-293567]|uniref:hypothetical protein n=1 Tax=Kribbella sp. CA-293567 TaxID=3002436 RepID=UPI0022DD5CF3|nr:hypothetical protein [Kribbella sp. CA-293567]WBQ05783.1 hypothetical protein OX958_03020 [Kribbella sp. CA-293567]